MTTPELISFITSQLQEGKGKEEIVGMLVQHGWAAPDIEEAFSEITPPVVAPEVLIAVATPEPEPQPESKPEPTLVSEPQPIVEVQVVQPQFVQPITYQAPVRLNWFKNPNIFLTIVSFLGATLLSGVTLSFLFATEAKQFVLSANTATGMFLVFSAVSFLVATGILTLVTRIIKAPTRSFSKAIVFTSILGIIAVALSLAHIPMLNIILIPVWFLLFCYYYEVNFLKSLAGFFLNLLFSAIVSVAIVMIGGTVFIKTFSQLTGLSMNLFDSRAQRASNQDQDAKAQAMLSSVSAIAERYKSTHEDSVGTSFQETMCNSASDSIQSSFSTYVNPPLLICTVSTRFPAKSYTVVAPSATKAGEYFCVDNTTTLPVMLSSLNDPKYMPGVLCQMRGDF